MTHEHFTIRNDMRVPVRRKSSDSVWPIRLADGQRPCDLHPEYRAKVAA